MALTLLIRNQETSIKDVYAVVCATVYDNALMMWTTLPWLQTLFVQVLSVVIMPVVAMLNQTVFEIKMVSKIYGLNMVSTGFDGKQNALVSIQQ